MLSKEGDAVRNIIGCIFARAGLFNSGAVNGWTMKVR